MECSITANGRGYKIVAEYEAKTYRTAQSYIRATALQVCTTTDMFYSLCYMPPFFAEKYFLKMFVNSKQMFIFVNEIKY